MDVEISSNNFKLALYGISGTVVNNNWGDTGFRLMNKMWEKVRENNLKNKGINVWVYEASGRMFTGVELDNLPGNEIGLELKQINLTKYAYYKHIGPYSLLAQAYSKMRNYLVEKGLETCFPSLEIYGHWDEDESKLETEIIMCIK